ncbi:MAG: HNH endonuclease [Allosphingosinicella sp.]
MTVERLRGRAGQRQRAQRLARTDGLCERCLGIGRWKGRVPGGRTALAERVNHIVPLIHGGSDDDENTENLCRPCDLEVTAEQFDFDVAEGGKGVDRSGRPTGTGHIWNANTPGGGSNLQDRSAGHRRPRYVCTESVFKVKSSGPEA